MAELSASADLRGQTLDLRLEWVGPGPRPGIRVIRRRWCFASSVSDGLDVVDLAELFQIDDTPWGRIERRRFLVSNSRAEAGLVQAQVALFYPTGATDPVRAVVEVYDGATQTMVLEVIDDVTRVETVGNVSEIFAAPGGPPEISAGIFTVTPGAPSHFDWAGGVSGGADFDLDEMQQTVGTAELASPLRVRFETSIAGTTIRTVEVDESLDADTGDWTRVVTVVDSEPSTRGPGAMPVGLTPSTTYYYAAFVPESGGFTTRPELCASAMATGIYGLTERLYDLVPSVHRYYDDPASGKQGSFQLKRFLQVFGAGLDLARGLGEGLTARHDVFEVRADHLAHLARWIGWDPDRTLPDRLQRTDILFAPELFSTVGTTENVKALANRMSGWTCDVKEFVENVAMTNVPETNHLWEVWQSIATGSSFPDPVPQPDVYPNELVTAPVEPAAFEGRPAAVLDAANQAVLFWHSNRDATNRLVRRQIWFQRLDGIDPTPQRALTDLSDDAPEIDEAPAALVEGPRVWLFWSSNRGGSQNLWARRFTGSPLVGNTPTQLTNHLADDRWPTAVRATTGDIWVFWQSNRRRTTTDIWGMKTADGINWDPPARISDGQPRDKTPSAAVDSLGDLRLFWSADRGDRSTIVGATLGAGGFGPVDDISDDTHLVRDESPSAVLWAGRLWLFWHSNRGGFWRIWARVESGGVWGAAFPLFDTAAAWKEPTAVVDGTGALRLFMRSQRGGTRFLTRTVDTTDTALLALIGTKLDRTHYTYDSERTKDAWYARDAVGLYLTPNDGASDDDHRKTVKRLSAFVTPFKPLPARLIWFLELGSGDFEPVVSDG